MGHLDNVLKMLFKLKSGVVIKRKDLADEFNVSEKQVTRYKRTLEEFFTIESIPGPTGGYRLLDSYFPFKELLTEDEVMLLKYYSDSLEYCNDKKLKRALDKINYSILKTDNQISAQIIPYSRINNNGHDIQKIQNRIYEAILHKCVVIIEYTSNEGKITKRRIEPYKLFMYKGECYVVAKCLTKHDIRYFKLVRISEIIVTGIKFEQDMDIERLLQESMEKNIGIFYSREYKLKLKIYPPMSNTIKERIWVDNQIITEFENGEILFEATMRGGPEIISWILSMRSYVQVVEPEDLKIQLKEEMEKMIKNLQK